MAVLAAWIAPRSVAILRDRDGYDFRSFGALELTRHRVVEDHPPVFTVGANFSRDGRLIATGTSR